MERTFFHPANLQEALSILAIHPHAAVVAGGTDLVVGARSGKEPLPPTLLAIDRIRELSDIRSTSEGGLEIGALATHAALEISITVQSSCTALSDASALVGSPATRNLGTIGGNICNASPAMELGSPLLIFDAAVELISIDGLRRLPFSAFVTGPGRTERRPSELLRSVIIPLLPSRGRLGSAYLRLEYRKAMEIAIVGAAAFLRMDPKGRCLYARIALTAVAPTCVRALGAESSLDRRDNHAKVDGAGRECRRRQRQPDRRRPRVGRIPPCDGRCVGGTRPDGCVAQSDRRSINP